MKLIPVFVFCLISILVMMPIVISMSCYDNYKRLIKKLNSNSESLLKTTNFTLTKDIPLKFSDKEIQHFYVDMKHQQICIFDYKNSTLWLTKFNDLKSYQIIKNNKIVVDSNVKENNVFDIYSLNKDDSCSDLRLLLHIAKNGVIHTVTYYFLINPFNKDNYATHKLQESSDKFLSIVNSIENFTSFFMYLLSFKINSNNNVLWGVE